MKNLQCAVYDSGHTKPSMWLQAKGTIQRPNSTDKTITNAIGRSEASTAFILRWEGERGTYKVDRVDLPHQSINTIILNIDRDWERKNEQESDKKGDRRRRRRSRCRRIRLRRRRRWSRCRRRRLGRAPAAIISGIERSLGSRNGPIIDFIAGPINFLARWEEKGPFNVSFGGQLHSTYPKCCKWEEEQLTH